MVEFGRLVSTRHGAAGIAPEDLPRHTYVLAGTGSGKTTLIRKLYKHLECANYTGVLASSAIYIDVKDEDALLFLRQCERRSFDEGRVTYLDLNRTGLAINLLELPRHDPRDREAVVSRMVGHVTEMFKEFYSQQQIFVQMERILRLLLLYLYSNTDTPTLIDLHDIILRLHRNRSELKRILYVYRNMTGPEMKDSLEALSSLPKDSWVPLMNRMEAFATDPYLKNRFAVRKSTVDFERMLEPGNITIFRISDTETPRYAHGLAVMAIVIKIWFAVQERAARMSRDERSLVLLTLDEFQRIRDLSIVTSILSQARTYNMGLVLSHQNLSQISDEVLETIVGNTATQMYGRISGIDAAKIGRIMDPRFAKELSEQIAVQPDFVFTMRFPPPPGSPQDLPTQFRMDPPPPLILSHEEAEEFICKMKQLQKNAEIAESALHSEDDSKMQWTKQLGAEFLTKDQWDVVRFLRRDDGNLRMITMGTNNRDRNRTKDVIMSLIGAGLVEVTSSSKIGAQTMRVYGLTAKAKSAYFPDSYSSIGTADDVDYIASEATEYYLTHGYFVSPARQEGRRDALACDLVAYDYDTKTAISVEIESLAEVQSHPEQVKYNMTKWRDLGFAQCHVWSRSSVAESIRASLDDADKVTVFTV